MPDKEELEQMLEEDYKQHLDPYEISRLETMRRAAKVMDMHDAESDYAIGGKHGNEEGTAQLG